MNLLLLLLATCAVFVAGSRDFYKILGVPKEAKDAQIKKAFRKLSLKYHPDKNPGDAEAAKKFVEVNDANDVLSNAEKRQVYDMRGEEGLKQHLTQQQQAQANQGMFGGFGDLFGQNQGGGKRGPDVKMELQVTLEEMYMGVHKQLKINRKVVCPHCRGTGAKGGDVKKCKKCDGQGVTLTLQQLAPGFNVQMQTPCPVCGGTGKIAKASCDKCSGHKTVMEEKTLDAMIERGMAEGEELVFERASEQLPDIIPGNVILVLRTQPHRLFRRDGNDLHYEQTITLREALLGYNKRITHLDGRSVDIRSDQITSPGQVRTVKGEGMPVHNFPAERGNLYVKFTIQMPKSLTKEQRKGIRTLLSEPGDSAPDHDDL